MAFFASDEKIIKKNEDAEVAYLATIDDMITAEIFGGVLKNGGVPCMLKDRFVGGPARIIAGTTSLGVDVYVARDALDEAKKLYEEFFAPQTEEQE